MTEGYVVHPRTDRRPRLLQAVYRGSQDHAGRHQSPRRFGREALRGQVDPVGAGGEGHVYPVVDGDPRAEFGGYGEDF